MKIIIYWNILNVLPMFIFLCYSEIMSKIIDNAKKYSLEPFRIWLGPYFGVIIAKPEDLQVITFLKQ